MSSPTRFVAYLLLFATVLILMATALCSPCAACGEATICAWKRTWHAPNALATPLRQYYVPRRPGNCCEDPAGMCGDAVYGAESEHAVGNPYGHAEIPVEPRVFDQLGRIPNDLAIAGGLGAAVAPPPGR
jgi:hypothetical protein